MSTSEPDTGFAFSQTERLSRRLHGLIRGYPRGLGILKEFIQNADDAGATELRVVLDLRVHRSERLPDPRMAELLGPALLLYNNARFKKEDLIAIRHIGESSKEDSGPKTGRFGLGFNTAYNITDHPSFATNNGIYCFDPHRDSVAIGEVNGRGWLLDELWQKHPDWPAAFEAGGLQQGEIDFDGTIFRLPMRTSERARVSDISKEVYGEDDVIEMINQAGVVGSELLLFTRNMERLIIERVEQSGSCQHLLTVEATNPQAARQLRRPLNEAVEGEWSEVLARWRRDEVRLPCQSGVLQWRVSSPNQVREENWRVVLALSAGRCGRLLAAAAEMLDHHEKAIPWMGVAARMATEGPTSVPGRLYCGLPLPVESGQPVHINAYFDLDDKRQRLTRQGDGGGAKVAARARWNQALLEEGVPWVWSRLLRELASEGVADLYAAFPQKGDGLGATAERVYSLLADQPVIPVQTSDGPGMARPDLLRLPPLSWREDLREPLIALGIPVAEPPLPEHVEDGFVAVVQTFDLGHLRRQIAQQKVLRDGRWTWEDLSCELAVAPNPALRRRDWVELLLRYARSDGSKALGGLPLLILCDGRLHTIGAGRFYLAADEHRALFPEQRSWFVDPDFASATGLEANASLAILRMTPSHVVQSLRGLLGAEESCGWERGGESVPNEAWLHRLLVFLNGHALEDADHRALQELAFLPGSDGHLHRPGLPSSPMVVPSEGSNDVLMAALRGLGIPILEGPDPLLRELELLFVKIQSLSRPLTGPNLVLALAERRNQLGDLGSRISALLDFLAEARWSYSEGSLQCLRSLPILPTRAGAYVAETESKVFLASAFEPPNLPLHVHILRGERHWGGLYEKLGIREIDGPRYLDQLLIPFLPELDLETRHEAAEWLRDNLQGILAKAGSAGAGLRQRIKLVELVWGPEGRLWAAGELHDPTSKIIDEVLGSEARYPDMARYRDRRDAWLGFFRSLGLVRELTTDAVVDHLDHLLVRGNAALEPIERLFKYLVERWKEQGDDLPKGKAANGPLVEALRQRAWLPSKQSSKHPGFEPPEDRLYQPAEIALDEALVGSQLPVSAWKVPADMASDLGIIRRPSAGAMLAHLARLIECWEAGDQDEVAAPAFGPDFHSLYRQLDRHVDPKTTKSVPRFTYAEQRQIRAISEEPCIWDSGSRRLWLPAHVFSLPVPYFAGLRTHLQPGFSDHFFDLLGRKESPDVEDHETFLGDLHVLVGEKELSPLHREAALHSLQAIHDPSTDEPLPLVTRAGRLQMSDQLYWDDAPWLTDRLGDLPVAAEEVPPELLRFLQVKRVSEHVRERLGQLTLTPIDPGAKAACDTLQRRLHATAFLDGVQRLCRHDHEDPQLQVDLDPLQGLQILPATSIRAEVILEETHSLGESDVKQYFDDQGRRLYLVGSTEARLAKWVVSAICRLLGEHAPRTTGSLEHILLCAPEEVEEVLNEDRISGTTVRTSTFVWADSEVDLSHGMEPADPSDDSTQEAGDPPPLGTSLNMGPRWARDQGAPSGPQEPGDAPRHVPLPRFPGGGTATRGLSPTLGLHLGDHPPQADKSTCLPSDALWSTASAGRPPEPSNTGRARKRRQGVGEEESFRIVPGDREPDKVSKEVEEKAVEQAMRHELEQGRSPRRMPKDNPGYDLESTDEEGEVRLIEVKGLAGDWRNHPAQITQTQLMYAIQYRESFWIYVVERTMGTPRLHAIRDPARHAGRFALSASWARFAETAPPPTVPKVGLILLDEGRELGPISQVKAAGQLHHVWTTAPNGATVRVTFQPGKHTLKDPANGDDAP